MIVKVGENDETWTGIGKDREKPRVQMNPEAQLLPTVPAKSIPTVADGEPPASPRKELESSPIFFQYLWFLLKACWEYPENRPKVNQIVEELAHLSGLQSTLSEA